MRIAHTMIRVGNLERSIQFYTEVLKMNVLAKKEIPQGRFTVAFLGYGDEYDGALLELTYNWDVDHYNLGSGYGHMALHVSDVYGFCDEVKLRGGVITREPGPKQYGSTVIAFLKDPDGYPIELLAMETNINKP